MDGFGYYRVCLATLGEWRRGDDMKAISLWQSWASFMVLGLKENETRNWKTGYRGDLLIHAAKKMIYPPRPLRIILDSMDLNLKHLPRGCIIGQVRLIDCKAITDRNMPNQNDVERDLGDYTPGRFMWITKCPKQLKEPVPFRGRQGFFNVPDEVLK